MTNPRDLIQRLYGALRIQADDNGVYRQLIAEARAYLAKEDPQSDKVLLSIRDKTPRYQLTITISTNDGCIDNRMGVIRLGLNPDTEILESVSLPKKLAPYGATREVSS